MLETKRRCQKCEERDENITKGTKVNKGVVLLQHRAIINEEETDDDLLIEKGDIV